MPNVNISLDHLPPFSFEVHGANDQYISPGIAAEGSWEPLETEVIRRCLDKDTDLYDVGANIGWYSVVGGLCLREGPGLVHAFEPVLDNAQLLLRNVAVNGLSNVRVNPCALGDDTRSIEMHLSPTNKGDHQAHGGEEGRLVQAASMTRFDRYHTPSGRKTFVKMDTQGSELAIIQGMGDYLHSIEQLTMLMEFWPMGLEHKPGNVERLIALLSGAGFKVVTVTEDENGVRPTSWKQLFAAAKTTLAPDTGHFVNLLVYRQDDFIQRSLSDLYYPLHSHHLPNLYDA
jgi:FkbM family methyltransferase